MNEENATHYRLSICAEVPMVTALPSLQWYEQVGKTSFLTVFSHFIACCTSCLIKIQIWTSVVTFFLVCKSIDISFIHRHLYSKELFSADNAFTLFVCARLVTPSTLILLSTYGLSYRNRKSQGGVICHLLSVGNISWKCSCGLYAILAPPPLPK